MNIQNQIFVYGDSVEFENAGDGVKRKILAYGDDMMQVEVHFEKGGIGKVHTHSNVQLTYVLSGKFEFTVGEETKVVSSGDTLYILPDVSHECVCLEKGILLDTFNPCRYDFLENK